MEVGKDFILDIFGLGACMNALLLIWKFPNEYRKHVSPGAIHTVMNFLGMAKGHKCRGSGYDEILI